MAQVVHAGIERIDLFALFRNFDVAFSQLCAEFVNLFLLVLELFVVVVHHFLEFSLGAFVALVRVAQLLLQVRDEFAVQLHGALNELHVFDDSLLVGAFALLVFNAHTSLGLVYLVEAILNLRKRFNQVVRLILRLSQCLTERIDGFGIRIFAFLFFFLFRAARHGKRQCANGSEQ